MNKMILLVEESLNESANAKQPLVQSHRILVDERRSSNSAPTLKKQKVVLLVERESTAP